MARMSIMIHEKVCQLVRERVPPDGRVLEISCGPGRNLIALREAGYAVQGTNFSKHEMLADDLPIELGVDVMQSLPYEDASFDAVLLCDVIEHLSDHAAALRNIQRVLKVGGILIMVTPNVMRINSRLHFLLTGFRKVKRSFIGFDVGADQAFAFHNHPPHLPELAYQLHALGLGCELDAIEYKPKSILMWGLLAPWIWLFTWYKTRHGEKFLKGTPAAKQLFKLNTSFKTLCGEAIVVIAPKREAAEAPGETKTRLPEWHEKIEA